MTKIGARVQNSRDQHHVTLRLDERVNAVEIPPQASGFGSSVSGGELLFLALATCYCNDIYREAAKRNIVVESVEVDVEGEFGDEGLPARNITYRARVAAVASEDEIRTLMRVTDYVAEIQNSLRVETPVVLDSLQVVSLQAT
ncbi:MAG: OsmC family protein [Anaerolineales bacterium]